MAENRNFIIAAILSVLVLLGWQYFFVEPRMKAEKAAQQAQSELAARNNPSAESSDPSRLPGVQAPGAATDGSGTTVASALAATPRIAIETPDLRGSFSLAGARFDDLYLTKYRETVDPTSPQIELLAPARTPHAYFSEFGFIPAPGASTKLPTDKTVWSVVSGAKLTPSTPLELLWDNGAGLIFHRTVTVDDHYMFTVKDRIENKGGTAVDLYPYGLISKTGKPADKPYYILHEGLIGAFDSDGLQEVKYAKVADSSDQVHTATNGWIGITDKYWAAVLAPEPGRKFTARFSEDPDLAKEIYQTDFRYEALNVPANGEATISNRFFAGAKVVSIVKNYEASGIYKFDLLIDWGWFYFITKPMFFFLDFMARHVGNFGIAILIVTIVVKAAFFPLANKSYKAMSKMKKLQPEMVKLRERYGDDKQKQQQELMALYKKEKVNPLAGCLPMVVQIPVFFSLYKVLFVTIEMRHAPFYGWIHDLSAPDPTTLFNLFGLIPWSPPHFLMIGIWPLIMGVTMFVQQKMNPAPADPIQQQIFTWMPIFFTFLLASFPAGLVIYWAWNNTLSVIQQGIIMKKEGVPIEIFDNVGIKKLFRRGKS
ncbi:MAG: membrane protein insertase YidC [Parvibaculaceae bacterium]|nr:membrane protein insertase YidC [Parvibaculaceae bacterium]